MATLHAADITDLVNSTMDDLGQARMTEIATTLQEYVAMGRLLKKGAAKFDSGKAITFNLLNEADDNARNVGLFNVDNVNQKDGSLTGTVPWRHTQTGTTFDVRQLSMNRGKAAIWDLAKEKRLQMAIGLAALMETNFWGQPDSSTDEDTPFGILYWMVYNATEGFNGGNNSNWASGPAGINSTTYTRWKHYTANYTNVSRTDLIRKLRKAIRKCNFRGAVPNPDIPSYNTGDQYGIYTTLDAVLELEERLEDQNDSLGNDVDSMGGRTVIRRIPIEDVPYITDNMPTADPFFGINWGVFKPVFLEGEYRRVTPFHQAPNQHNVRQMFEDTSWNLCCYDRRRLFLVAKSDPVSG